MIEIKMSTSFLLFVDNDNMLDGRLQAIKTLKL